ncbi:MAG: hypothetical protein HPY69_20345 [Armatimonadetes bacterium]|nr:hypothetical protein [Armatimonadota bacterium]
MRPDWRTEMRRWVRRPELVAATGVLLALLLVVRPLPGPLLDVLLAASLGLSLAVLLLTLFAERPAEFTPLPEVLVLASLGRVALGLGVARTILATGEAGGLVRVVGEQLTGGGAALVSGIAVLVVLALASFLVVTTGVMRLAEVSARFALDALPGRQMAIDAALAAGRMTLDEGREAIQHLEAQNGFLGAMDGVARFLRGETVATFAIVSITPLAALLNGGMERLAEWAQTYLLLAAGHGAVIVIPGVLMGAAAAVVLARSGRDSLAHRTDWFASPALLFGTAGVLLVLGLIPAASSWPLLVTGGLILVAALASRGHRAKERAFGVEEQTAAQLRVHLGLGLIGLVANQDLVADLGRATSGLADELGFALPPLTVTDRGDLGRNEYLIEVGGDELGRGELRVGQRLMVLPGAAAMPVDGLEVVLPDGRRGAWVGAETAQQAVGTGHQMLRPGQVLALHLEVCLRARAAQLFGLQQARDLLAALEVTHPAVVSALAAAGATPELLRDVGRLLLAEGIPLNERLSLVEAIASAATRHRCAETVAEAVRVSLQRTITRLAAPHGGAEVITLDPELERELQEACEAAGEGPVTFHPERAQAWHATLRTLGQRHAVPGRRVVLYCSRPGRRAVGQLIREAEAALLAVCHEELHPLTVIEAKYRLEARELQAAHVLARDGE